MTHPRHIVLIGPMATGKTTIGTILAELMDLPFLDSDAMIEITHRRTGAAIAQAEGVGYLHEIEAATFVNAVGGVPAVIAPAASVLDDPACVEHLKEQTSIALTAPLTLLLERINAADHRRSVSRGELNRLIRERAEATLTVSTGTFDTSTSNPQAIANQIVDSLRDTQWKE